MCPHSGEWQNSPCLQWCWFAHFSASKVKAKSRPVCPLKPRHLHSSLFCCSWFHIPRDASLHLGWTQLPSADPAVCRRRARGFAEPRVEMVAGCAHGQAPVFASSTLGQPYGSCPALNPSTGTACKVNCSTTQCFTSAIYILPVTTWVIRASAAWWCSLRPADFPSKWHCTVQCLWQDFFLPVKSLRSCWIWHDLPQEKKKSTLCFRNRIRKISPLLTTYRTTCAQSSWRDLGQVI